MTIHPLPITLGRCHCRLQNVPRGRFCAEHTHRWINPTPDPARTLDGLRRAAGLPVRAVERAEGPRGLLPLEWRRQAWQVIRQLADGGERITARTVIDRLPPCPDPNGTVTVEGLLMTAAYDQHKLSKLPTGEYVGRAPALNRAATTTGLDHPATSHAAARSVLPKTGTQRRAVYDALLERPRTDVELQTDLYLPANSERPRRVELVEAGLVEDSGTTRSHHGQPHVVWRVRA